MRTSTSPRSLFSSLLLILVLTASAWSLSGWADPAMAHAQDKQLESYLAGATEDYDLVMLEDAEQKLKEAIAYAEGKGLVTPQVAKIYVLLGIVKFANTQKASAAEKEFIKAVEIDPKVIIDPVYETPELAQIMNRARAKAKPPKGKGGGKKPTSVAGFSHTPVATAEAGTPLTLEVAVPESMPVFRVFLYHRRFGETNYVSQEMGPTGSTQFVTQIPGEVVTTSQLDYYIEALDRGGKVLANSATKDEPYNVVVLGSGDVKKVVKVGETDVKPIEKKGPGTDKVFYAMLGAGTGGGFLPGGTPTAYPDDGRDINPGLAPAFAHGLIDLGWIINEQMRLGLYFRWQFQPTQNFDDVPELSKGGSFPSTKDECLGFGLFGDCLLGLKYRYYLTEGDPEEDVRFYSSVGMGVGRIRHWVRLKERARDVDGNVNQNCLGKEAFQNPGEDFEFCYLRDTVRTGWGHVGLGGGLSVPLAEMVEFTADTYLMFLFLDQTSINLDANIGVAFKF